MRTKLAAAERGVKRVKEKYVMFRILTVVAILIFSGCTTVANISIEDHPNYKKELFRYIVWNGEKYGPRAFMAASRKKGVDVYRVQGSFDEQRKNCISEIARINKIDVELNGVLLPKVESSIGPLKELCAAS